MPGSFRFAERINAFVRFAKGKAKQTRLSMDQSRWFGDVGSIHKKTVSVRDYHNPVSEWIGTARKVAAPIGAAFGKPTNATDRGVYWNKKSKATMADTSPQRKSLVPTRDGTPPNPGRLEFGSEGYREGV